MASEEKKLAPKAAEQVRKAAAGAKEEVLNPKTMEALLRARPEDLISADAEAEVIKGNANPPGCWIHSPGMVEFFAAADRRLTRVANWAGNPVKRVEKVNVRLLKGTKLMIVDPANPEDLTAIPVNRYGSSATFNAFNLLAEFGLTVETGYRERYDVAFVPKTSPLWPALVIDLGQMKERRAASSAKKDG